MSVPKYDKAWFDRYEKAIDAASLTELRERAHELLAWLETATKEKTQKIKHALDSKRKCEHCGKMSRITTAGCDHCDFEDK